MIAGYIQCRSLREAHVMVAAADARESHIAREIETAKLCAEFARIDLQVHDDYSLTGCVRERTEA